jgi:predicted transcriptional regulator
MRAHDGDPVKSSTLTVRLPTEVREKLGHLAERTRRTRSFLAGEAIADFVERELEIVAAIEQGVEDMKAGRVVPHDEAMRQVRATIEKAAKGTP